MNLFIDKYNKKNIEQINKSSVFVQKTFFPETFRIDFFPTKVNDDNFKNLIKNFYDIFHETRFEKYLAKIASFSKNEVDLILSFLKKFDGHKKRY